jgi:hypothetical protein
METVRCEYPVPAQVSQLILRRYCENMKEDSKEDFKEDLPRDPLQMLQTAERDDIMLFLEWILDNYPSRKKISIIQKFKHWRQLFRKYAGRTWPDSWRSEVNDVRLTVWKR